MRLDFQFALRAARKSPGWTSAVVCTLALGIGANAVIFSVVSGVLLRPLPFADPGRLAQLNESDPTTRSGPVYYQDLEAWRTESRAIESAVAYVNISRSLENVAEPERLAGVWCERGLFRLLDVAPMRGRYLRDDDPPNVAVIAASLWRRRFNSDPSAIGRGITLDGEPHTIVGVMPDGFLFPYRAARAEVWIPWRMPPAQAASRNSRVDAVVARLRPGVSVEAARRELAALSRELTARYPETNRGRAAVVTPLVDAVAGDARGALLAIEGAVGLVLLIACANVTNLLLARAGARTQEFAVRVALGAGRARLARQLILESALLGVAGGVLALAVTSFGTSALVKLASSKIPRAWEIGPDWRVFGFLLAVSLAAGVVCGIAPGLAAARANLHAALAGSSRTHSGGRKLLRDAIAVAQIALAFILTIGAGSLLEAFLRLERTPTGLVAGNVLTLRLTVKLRDWTAPGSYGRYLSQLEERIREVPGVRSAGFIQYLPLGNFGWSGGFTIKGRPLPVEQGPHAELRYVTPGYFGALGIPLRKGRLLSGRDTPDAPRVILVNEALARTYFPGEDPVGRETDRGTIVGVVGDVRQAALDRPAAPEIYYAFAQNTAATSEAGVSLAAAARGQPEALAADLRRAIREVNPNQAVFDVRTMRQVIAGSLADLKLYTSLVGLFAALALALSLAGVYSVVAHGVAARTREFGIRLALGAGAARILRLVLGHGSAVIALGLAMGAAGALALTRTLRAMLASVDPPAPGMILALGALLAATALAACVIPARRAMEVDPNTALKYE